MKLNKSESIAAIAKALASFQSEVKQPFKDRTNPFFSSKYVPLENIVEVITQTAPKHGLSFMQYPVSNENRVGVKTLVLHESGEFIETEPVYTLPDKQTPQATGSAITYLKRYSLAAVFGITSDQDDDGNAASQPSNAPTQSTTPKAPTTLPAALEAASKKTGKSKEDLYKEVSSSLKIDKPTKELTTQEKNAIISVLNKK